MSLDTLFRKEAIEYQRGRLWGEVVLIQPMRYFIITAVVCVMLIVVGLFLYSQNYSRKESVIGYLVPDAGIAKIFASQPGVIAQINVVMGQQVKKGDPIAKIVQEKWSQSGVSSQSELLQSVRREIKQLKTRYNSTFIQEDSEVQNVNKRISGLELELAKLIEEKEYQSASVSLIDKQYIEIVNLTGGGFVSRRIADDVKANLIKAKQAEVSLERQETSILNAVEEARGSLAQLSYRFDEQRANLNDRKETLYQQATNLEQAKGYIVLSTIDGMVTGVLATPGSQLNTSAVLVTIRPANTKLHARLLVPSRASGLIDVGQNAKIQYDAFPYQRFGVYTGIISAVSQSILSPNELTMPVPISESFYLVDMALDKQFVDVKGQHVPLKAGMAIKADIILENRTLMQWLLDPLFSVTKKL